MPEPQTFDLALPSPGRSIRESVCVPSVIMNERAQTLESIATQYKHTHTLSGPNAHTRLREDSVEDGREKSESLLINRRSHCRGRHHDKAVVIAYPFIHPSSTRTRMCLFNHPARSPVDMGGGGRKGLVRKDASTRRCSSGLGLLSIHTYLLTYFDHRYHRHFGIRVV